MAWYIGPNYISWVPLAPGEIYLGHSYYGPYSVNINRTNINIQRNVFINAKVKDAVVTIPKDSFFKKQPVTKVILKENPFLNPGNISAPPVERPLFKEKTKTPSRVVKGIPERSKTDVMLERRPPVESEKRDSISSPNTLPDHPRVQERKPQRPQQVTQPVPRKIQEITPQEESTPAPMVRKEGPLSNRVILRNQNPNSPTIKERLGQPSPYHGSTPILQKGIERTYPLSRNERGWAEKSFQERSRFSIPLQPLGR